MRDKSHSAPELTAQATTFPASDRTDDVAEFIARHGATICPPGKTSKSPKKPVSAKARKLHPHRQCWSVRRSIWRRKSNEELREWINRPATANIPAPQTRKRSKQRAFLQQKGRAAWQQLKKEHPLEARERLRLLEHFWSI